MRVFFKQSVEWISRRLDRKEKISNTFLLIRWSHQSPAIKVLEIFSKDNEDNVKHWIYRKNAWKENIFLVLTSFDAPQSNQAKAVHAGWKRPDRMGVDLLQCCYFHIRDSILLAISFSFSVCGRLLRTAGKEIQQILTRP